MPNPSRDLPAGATVQIRDRSIALPIATLNEAGNYPVPGQIVRGLLDAEWIHSSTSPKPLILSKNERIRASLKGKPVLTISMEGYNENWHGHRHEWVDVEVPLLIEIEAIADSWDRAEQTCFNVLGEVQRIWSKWILALKPFHSLWWDGFTEDYEQGTNHCKLDARIRMTARWPSFRRRVAGEEIPAEDPTLFTPDGDNTGDL